jgi:mannosyltransferase OCH1-like enzyme
MIPRIIHQTWKDADVSFWVFKRSVKSIQQHLPEWKYQFWTDADLDFFMKSEFSRFYERWLNLDKHIKRVDIARYCMLYKFGGIYADLDFVFTRNPEDLLDEDRDLFFYRSTQALVKQWDFLGNAFMISVSGQEFWMDVTEHMLGLPAGTPVLKHTGPLALGAYYASLPEKPRARIFDPSLFDNERCQDGVGEKRYGYHIRAATWQRLGAVR